MKTILVAVEQADNVRSLLETTCLLAAQHASHVEGYAPRPIMPGFVGDAGMVAIADIEDPKANEEESRRIFQEYVAGRDIPVPAGMAKPTFQWSEASGKAASSISELARVFDVTMVGRAALGGTAPLMSTFEPILFESGRPVIVAPPTPPGSIGQTVVIAWNRSTEAARATALAMPLLRVAKRIVVMTTEGSMVPGPSGKEAVRHLRRNGIEAEAIHVESGTRSAGEALLGEAIALGCDLMIKGAYTQSRLRQMIFGGLTRYLLNNATVPLFMSH